MKTNDELIAISAIVAILVAILVAVMIAGCVEKEVPISNVEFKNITGDALADIALQLEDIVTAKQDGDFVTAKIRLATLDASLVEYISLYEEMAVAENTLPCKKAVILVFKETQILGVYIHEYLESLTIEDYMRYGTQSQRVANQVEIGAMLSKNL